MNFGPIYVFNSAKHVKITHFAKFDLFSIFFDLSYATFYKKDATYLVICEINFCEIGSF